MSRGSTLSIMGLAAALLLSAACSDSPTDPALSDSGTSEQLVPFTPPPPDKCGDELTELYSETQNATSLGRDKTGLLNKVARAAMKLEEDKPHDALQKLSDFDTKLTALEDTIGDKKEKISQEDADALRLALEDALACVADLL